MVWDLGHMVPTLGCLDLWFKSCSLQDDCNVKLPHAGPILSFGFE